MRRTVLVLPNLIGPTPDDSPLLQKLESLRAMTELGELKRLRPLPQMETPEAVWLGMKPDEAQMRQGPLTVSALGFDLPERSTHFHVSLLGVVDQTIKDTLATIPEEELRIVLEQSKRLNTKTLTFLAGENKDHGLVWEGLGDMQTVAPKEAIEKPIRSNLPEGDADRELRRFIDDSVNLLTGLELNERRLDEGIAPLNLLWPWGEGRRKAVPNLFLKRGYPVNVESNSMRLAGLTRLVGYKHGDRSAFGQGTNTRLQKLSGIALKNDTTVIVIEAPGDLRAKGMLEELHWFIRELDSNLLKPLFANALKGQARIDIVAPGEIEGLALTFSTGMSRANIYPFDERSLEEKSLSQAVAWEVIDKTLTPEATHG